MKPQSGEVRVVPHNGGINGFVLDPETQGWGCPFLEAEFVQDFCAFTTDVDDLHFLSGGLGIAFPRGLHQDGRAHFNVEALLPAPFFLETVDLAADDDDAKHCQNQREGKRQEGLFARDAEVGRFCKPGSFKLAYSSQRSILGTEARIPAQHQTHGVHLIPDGRCLETHDAAIPILSEQSDCSVGSVEKRADRGCLTCQWVIAKRVGNARRIEA